MKRKNKYFKYFVRSFRNRMINKFPVGTIWVGEDNSKMYVLKEYGFCTLVWDEIT